MVFLAHHSIIPSFQLPNPDRSSLNQASWDVTQIIKKTVSDRFV
jgi:hypothetical protein